MVLSILDVKPVVDPTLLPMLSGEVFEPTPSPQRPRVDDSIAFSHHQESSQIVKPTQSQSSLDGDDGGGKFTQDEKEHNDLACKIINMGIRAQRHDEVGIDLIISHSETGKPVHPQSIEALNYIQRKILIELFEQAINGVNGRFWDGIRLKASEISYAEQNGIHIQTLKSMINFAALYVTDSSLYDKYRDDDEPSQTANFKSTTASS